jgi:hypothetical protein
MLAGLGDHRMHDDDDWEAAEAALKRARSLPGGAERVEALRQAGKLRFVADRKRYKKEQRDHGRPSKFAFIRSD